MYRGKKKGGESGGGVGTHHLMNHLRELINSRA